MSEALWRHRRVFVTGATGLVGRWLVRHLLEYGADIVILMRDQLPDADQLPDRSRVTVVRGDVCDQMLLERVLGDYEIQTVFHLAAQTLVPVANRNPISTFESNIRGTWVLLEACRHSPMVKQIIIASSDKAYGEVDDLPYREDTSLKAVYPYDVSKACTDMIALSYAKTWGMPVCVTRCGNFYGGGDMNWNRIVPGTVRSLIHGDQPVIRSDGLSIRDYIYVMDAAMAYRQLAEKIEENPSLWGEAFNFSNGSPINVRDLVNLIGTCMGIDVNPIYLNQTRGEIRNQFLDAQKAQTILGWRPSYDLSTGLGETILWYKDYFHRQKHV